MKIFELILFFASSQIILISITGYGEKLNFNSHKDKILDWFLKFIYGLIFLNILGFFLHYLNINNKIINLFIIVIGLLLFDFAKFKDNIIKIFFYNLILFSGILISKMHEDWPYHFSYIEQVSSFNPILGIGNIDDIHILSASFFSYLQKIFYLPYFNFKIILISYYLIYLNIIFILVEQIRKKITINIKFLFLLILSIYLIKFSRLSEFGYDYISNFFLINILIFFIYEFYKKLYIKNNLWIYSLFFIYACTIKITSIFFFPIFLAIIFSQSKSLHFTRIFYFNLVLILTFLLDSFLKSGCIFYFFTPTCFDQENVLWSIDTDRIYKHSNHVTLWAKGFYHQTLYSDPNVYLANFNWVKNWINIHFFYKVFEFLIIPIIFLIFIIMNQHSKFKVKNLNIFICAAILSVLLWFYFIPQLRFGTANIIFLFSIFLITFLNQKTLKNVRNNYIIIYLIIMFSVYNIKNLNRIYNEFERTDVHKFTNFPYPPKNRLKAYDLNNNDIKYLLYKNKKNKKIFWFNIIY